MLLCLGGLFGHKKVKAQNNCLFTPGIYSNQCLNTAQVLNLNNPLAGYIYTWSCSGNAQLSNNTGVSNSISFNTIGSYTVTVVGTANGSASLNCSTIINCVVPPTPIINANTQVGCNVVTPPKIEGTPSVIPAQEPCMQVCRGLRVTYSAISNNTIPLPTNKVWTVTGGLFSVNSQAIYIGPNAPNITWDNTLGTGYLTVAAAINATCTTSATICVKRIDIPEAIFTANLSPNQSGGFNACNGQGIYFIDQSTPLIGGTTTNNIVAWLWDFGDGTFSSVQNPTPHIYNNAGLYNVTLTVTNSCGCTSQRSMAITVDNTAGPDIMCPKVACNKSVQVYKTSAQCSSYNWSVQGGGDIYINAVNVGTTATTTDPYIEVHWNTGASGSNNGFGIVTLDVPSCNGLCSNPTTIKVPIITNAGLVISRGVCINDQFQVTMPEWPATDFTWSVTNVNGTNTTLLSPATNDRKAIFNAGNVLGAPFIHVDINNTLAGCHLNLDYEFYIHDQPTIIATKKVCSGNSIHASLQFAPNFTLIGSVVYTLSGNGFNSTFTSNIGTSSMAITLPNTPGFYTLMAHSPIFNEFCDPKTINIEVVAPPPATGPITGPLIACAGTPVNYNVAAQPNNIFTTWSGGLANNLPAVGNEVNLMWLTGSTFTLNAINAWADLPNCKSAPETINVLSSGTNGSIASSLGFVEDCNSVVNFTMLGPGTIDNIFWKLDPNTPYGNISINQGTQNPTVTWYHINGNNTLNAIILCDITICGNTFTKSLPVVIKKAAAPLNITNPNGTTFCSGVAQTFSFNCNTNFNTPSTYIIDWGDGSSNTVINNTYSISNSHTYINTSSPPGGMLRTISVKVIDACSGVASDPITLQLLVKPEPSANLTSVGSLAFCLVTNTTLYISSNQVSTFDWQLNGVSNGNTTNTLIPTTAGSYQVVVSYNGCTTIAGPQVISGCPPITGSGAPNPCNIPAAQMGVSQVIGSTLGCGQGQATAVIVGAPSAGWSCPGGVPSGSGAGSTSPIFTFAKAGIYPVKISFNYGSNCYTEDNGSITIPVVPEFRYGFQCNGTNSGYDLKLEDLSTVAPGFTGTGRNFVLTIAGITNIITNNNATYLHALPASASGTTIQISIIRSVGAGVGTTCTSAIASVVVPILPVAAFTASTTDPFSTGTAYKTCEYQNVSFNNMSGPIADIIKNSWDFGNTFSNSNFNKNQGYSQIASPVKVFQNLDNNINTQNITLTVTNIYGCVGNITKPIDVYDNAFGIQLPNAKVPKALNSNFITYNLFVGA